MMISRLFTRGVPAVFSAVLIVFLPLVVGCTRADVDVTPAADKPRTVAPSSPDCRVEKLVNSSFVGTYQGRTLVLHIEEIDDRGTEVSFEYSATLSGSDRLFGKGVVERKTCRAVLSTFDSKAHLVATNTGWAFESVDPSWRLDASVSRGSAE